MCEGGPQAGALARAMEIVRPVLGNALLPRQLRLMGVTVALCFALQYVASSPAVARRLLPVKVQPKLTAMVHRSLGLSAVNTVHSIAVSLGGLGLLLFDDVAAAQPVYGNSRWAQTITAIATGFFIWDVYVVVTRVRDPARMDPALVVHGHVCFSTLLFGQ